MVLISGMRWTDTTASQVLQLRGRGLVEYDGSMSKAKREAAIAKFHSDDQCRVMLISNVGSAGLNLTDASVVIFVVSKTVCLVTLVRY